MAALFSALPTLFLVLDRIGMTIRDTQASAIPGMLCSGAVFLSRSASAS